ncbi:hypothetical protein GGER_07560 [Serratia rubidaea]
MSTPRLQQQFIRLWQRCQGETRDTTLQELADALSCSRRHVRSLLGAMQQQGWLTWQAEAGRGKRSRLEFHYTGLALQQQRAETLLEQDRIDQLVQLVGDKKWCARCCCPSSGAASVRENTFCACSTTARCPTCCPARRCVARKPTWPDKFTAA